MMFYVNEQLISIPGASNITEPWNHTENGKWLINTDTNNFHQVGYCLKEKLHKWINDSVPPDAMPSQDFQDMHPITIHYTPIKNILSPPNSDTTPHVDDDSTLATIRSYETTAKSYYSSIYKALQESIPPSSVTEEPTTKTPDEIFIEQNKCSPNAPASKSWSSIVSGHSSNTISDITPNTIPKPILHNKGGYGPSMHTGGYGIPGDNEPYGLPTTFYEENPLNETERQEFNALKAEVSLLRHEMKKLKKDTDQTSTSPPPPQQPLINNEILKLTAQYEQMQLMFMQQQKIVNYFLTKIDSEHTGTQPTPPHILPTHDEGLSDASKAHNAPSSPIPTTSPPPPPPPIPKLQTDFSTPTHNLDKDTDLRKNLFPSKDGKRPNQDTESENLVSSASESTHKNKRHDIKSTPPPRKKPPDPISTSTNSTSSTDLSRPKLLIKNPYTKRSSKNVPARPGQVKNE